MSILADFKPHSPTRSCYDICMIQFDDRLLDTRVDSLRRKEEEDVIATLAPRYGIPYINLHGITIDVEALNLLSEQKAREAEIAIFARHQKTLSVAVRNPQSPKTIAEIEALKQSGYTVESRLVSLISLEHAWERYKDTVVATAEKKGVLDIDPDAVRTYSKEIRSHLDASTRLLQIQATHNAEKISRTIEVLFGGALALGASDIHIEPERTNVRFRYRIDGVLWDVTSVASVLYQPLASRL